MQVRTLDTELKFKLVYWANKLLMTNTYYHNSPCLYHYHTRSNTQYPVEWNMISCLHWVVNPTACGSKPDAGVSTTAALSRLNPCW